jgi:hypothetical protein
MREEEEEEERLIKDLTGHSLQSLAVVLNPSVEARSP